MRGRRSLKPVRTRSYHLGRVKILLPLIFILCVVILSFSHFNILNTNDTNYTTVKVLIYSGSDTNYNCIYQTEKCLDESNLKNYVPGIKFTYNTSNIINEETLSGYDVVIMPGSENGFSYVNDENIDVDDLKSYVASGKGFVGICAGAYSGAEYTDSWYYGWGLAPNVNNVPYLETGNVTIDLTSQGSDIISFTNDMISHVNGPAMYTTSNQAVVFATYSNPNSSYNGYAAIVGDYYGDGRTVLSGVHPELTPQNAEMMVDLIIWAYNGTYENNTTTNVTS